MLYLVLDGIFIAFPEGFPPSSNFSNVKTTSFFLSQAAAFIHRFCYSITFSHEYSISVTFLCYRRPVLPCFTHLHCEELTHPRNTCFPVLPMKSSLYSSLWAEICILISPVRCVESSSFDHHQHPCTMTPGGHSSVLKFFFSQWNCPGSRVLAPRSFLPAHLCSRLKLTPFSHILLFRASLPPFFLPSSSNVAFEITFIVMVYCCENSHLSSLPFS